MYFIFHKVRSKGAAVWKIKWKIKHSYADNKVYIVMQIIVVIIGVKFLTVITVTT